ncbi:MAG TPA: hypothetical protein VM324_10160 [Egibacteraceae bacterium]|nr:hypothetical protein [Egibacteraceae bacterium]
MAGGNGQAAAKRMVVTAGPRMADLPHLRGATADVKRAVRVVASVLPFKVNNYVVEELIDWSRVPDDPIYQLTFPQAGMLAGEDFDRVAATLDGAEAGQRTQTVAHGVRLALNPHPGDQLERNRPRLEGEVVNGLQHKYRETLLIFPAAGQTCHTYCGYCFRWAQFVGTLDLRQGLRKPDTAVTYLREHPEVTDVLYTGGDPLVMAAPVLRRFVDPLLAGDLEHVRNIRFGTKALSYWPYRFTSDRDAGQILRLLEDCVAAGRHVAVMAHFSHPRELDTPVVAEAIRLVRNTGAVIRAQAPLVRHVNDKAAIWSTMWRALVRHGCIPYYMFVERDTGARRYFEVPLSRAFAVYRDGIAQVSGLERTARGPVMSTSPGKIIIDGIADIAGERVFALRFLQARNPDWVARPFFARYTSKTVWLDGLRPAFGQAEFFHERDHVQDWRQTAALN